MSAGDGGPAFPCVPGSATVDGMSLRDYFAAKAMQSFIAREPSRTIGDDEMAHEAYLVADAMLSARERGR